MSYAGLGQTQTLTGERPVMVSSPNWVGMGILAGIGVTSGAAAAALTRSSKKAAVAAASAVALVLLAQPLIPFAGSDRLDWVRVRRGVLPSASATIPGYVRGSGNPMVIG